jgi:hypothetical protein
VRTDGAFAALQRFMVEQQQAGRLLCLASKNEEADEWRAIAAHPEKPLRPDHILAHRIVWQRKSESLRELAAVLGLGLNRLVFVDDSPVERDEVATALPEVLVHELMHQFLIPQAGIRVWGASAEHAALPFARTVSADVRSFASSLSLPYCGANAGFEAATWLDDASTVASLALIPLRHGSSTDAFGLLVLGSPDPTRFAADMGTEFLMRIGEVSSAGLSRLIRD